MLLDISIDSNETLLAHISWEWGPEDRINYRNHHQVPLTYNIIVHTDIPKILYVDSLSLGLGYFAALEIHTYVHCIYFFFKCDEGLR